MKFQILDAQGTPLSMGELDKEAAEFFGVPYNEKRYASPPSTPVNWHDVIGYNIASSEEGMLPWYDIIGRILRVCTIGTSTMGHLDCSIKVFRPYISLCYHWKSKGYTPVCL